MLLARGSVDGLGESRRRRPDTQRDDASNLGPSHPGPKCKMGGKLTSCGTEEGTPTAKGDLGFAETLGEAGEGSPRPCQQVRRQGRRERHRDAKAAKEEGPTAESKLTEAAEAPAATSGPGCGGRGPQSFGDPGGRARGPHPGPHQLQTQNPAAPRLPRPPRRPRQAQKRPVPRPETLAPNSDQTVAVTVRRSARGKKYCLTTTYVYVCDSLCPFVHTSLSYTNLFQIGSNDIIAEEKGCGVIMGGRRWENGNSDFVGKYLMYLPSTLPVSPGF